MTTPAPPNPLAHQLGVNGSSSSSSPANVANAQFQNNIAFPSPQQFNLTAPRPGSSNGTASQQPQPQQQQQQQQFQFQPNVQNGNGGDQAQAQAQAQQARLAMTQQLQAQAQANMQMRQQNEASGQNLQNGGGGGEERKLSGPQIDWMQMAQLAGQAGLANGVNNIQSNTKEALMKQLQALQTSHAQATRNRLAVAGGTLGMAQSPPQVTGSGSSPAHPAQPGGVNATASLAQFSSASPATNAIPIAPSPASYIAPSPSNHNMAAPSPANLPASSPANVTTPPNPPITPQASAIAANNHSQLPTLNGVPPPTGFMTEQQRAFLIAQQERMRQQQSVGLGLPNGSSSNLPSSSVLAPSPQPHTTADDTSSPTVTLNQNPNQRPASQRAPLVDQRKQFLISITSFYKSNNITPPPEMFNGERDGAVKIAGVWFDLVELFLLVMKHQGIQNILKTMPLDGPFWQNFVLAKGLPMELSTPIALPRVANQDPSAPLTFTTKTVEYLIAAYFIWLQPFEAHMQKSRFALYQRQAAAAVSAGQPVPSASTGMTHPSGAAPPQNINNQAAPSLNGMSAASPANPLNSAQLAMAAATPQRFDGDISTPSADIAPTPSQQTAPSPAPSIPPTPSTYAPTPSTVIPPSPYMQNGRPAVASGSNSSPGLVKVESGPANTLHLSDSAAQAAKKRRKRDKGSLNGQPLTPGSAGQPSTLPPTPNSSMPIEPVERPPTPKRARYRVEYKPLHHVLPNLGGWDERAVASTFPKYNLGHQTRSVHELGVVDMESILMSLRSRIPHEIGYAMTVLSMLSMPHPEENIAGLPLIHIQEIYMELLELIGESVFGEEGYAAWTAIAERETNGDKTANSVSLAELERLGKDSDLSLDISSQREQSGLQTDIILTGLNLLRNFSLLPDNMATMASYTELFELLAAISDVRLCRFSHTSLVENEKATATATATRRQPYSVMEFARVRRDCMSILANLGMHVDLRSIAPEAVTKTVQVISSFLSCGFEMHSQSDSLYGPSPSPTSREAPVTTIPSVQRAVEAFCKLSFSDTNREVLSRLPSKDIVAIFDSLVKLLPMDRRQFEALFTIEDYLGHTETIALSLYSLAFLSSLPTRSLLRSIPGAVSNITRIIYTTGSGRGYEWKASPYTLLCRRLAETLGVLNGTAGTGVDGLISTISFSAAAQKDKGWSYKSSGGGGGGSGDGKAIEKGWLAHHEELVMDVMSVRGIDIPAFVELDGLWWAGGDD